MVFGLNAIKITLDKYFILSHFKTKAEETRRLKINIFIKQSAQGQKINRCRGKNIIVQCSLK